MNTLSRYLVRESLGPFLFGLAIITIVLVMDFLVDIMNLIINKGLGIALVLEIFALNLAWMLALAVPMAVLVAVLMTFGRLSSDNEITACKSCGISFSRLLFPMLAAGLVLTLAMIWFNDRVLPESNHRARMLLTDVTRKKPTWSLEENIFLDHFEGYSIKVRTIARKTSEIEEIIVIQTANKERIITAREGLIYFSPDGSMLMLELENGEILEVDSKNPDGYTLTKFVKQTIAIPGASSNLERSTESMRGDREMNVAMMLEQNREKKERIVNIRSQADTLIRGAVADLFQQNRNIDENLPELSQAAEKAFQANKQIRARLTFLGKNAANYKREINSMNVEIQKKFSIPVACIAFVLIGAPLGSLARKGGFATGIGLSLFFFIVYWAFLIGGEQMADAGILPAFWAMWLPNFVLSFAGLMLIWMFVRQSTVISLVDRLRSLIRIGLPKRDGTR